jgi:hypothetical protein
MPMEYATASARPGDVPRRSEARLPANLEVRILGIDANGHAFHQPASTLDISLSGARVTGLTAKLNPGDIVGLQSGGGKNRFQVSWIIGNRDGSYELGLRCTEKGASPWRDRLRAPALSAGGERRKDERYACNGSVSLRSAPLRQPILGTVRDVSASGCYVQTSQVAELGDILAGQFTFGGMQLNAVVEVRSALESVGMGLAWCDLGCNGEARLEKVLRTLGENRLGATNGRAQALAKLDTVRALLVSLRERLEDEHMQVKAETLNRLDDAKQELTAALRSVQP